MRVDLLVPGKPEPQGSKTAQAYIPKGGGKPKASMRDDNPRLKAWRRTVTETAIAEGIGETLMEGPLAVWLRFSMPRPKGHYGTGRNAGIIKPTAPLWPASRPDIDKLCRAVFDSLTVAAVWADDGQVVYVNALEAYCSEDGWTGVRLTVRPMTEWDPARDEA